MHNSKHEKQRIGLVLFSVPMYSETFFRSKIEGLTSQGFEVVLFVYDIPSKKEALPCTVCMSPMAHQNFIKKQTALSKALLQAVFKNPKRSRQLYKLDRADGKSKLKSFKNVIANQFIIAKNLDWIHFGFGTLAVGRENLASVINAKMGVSFRGFDLYISPLKRTNYYNVLFEKPVQYHVLSQEMQTDLSKQGIPEKNIRIINPAIDTDFFDSKTPHKVEGPLRMLTVGRLHWKKGLVYTLEAMALLKRSGLIFEYLIIGEGEELERLKFAVYQLGLGENVKFLGKQAPEKVRDYMITSDCYVQYSIQEGFCNAVLEAQAMGLLCFVSNAEGLQENVLNDRTGWVIEKRSPNLLAEKILGVLELDERQKQDVREAAKKRIQENFNLKKQQHEFYQFYTM